MEKVCLLFKTLKINPKSQNPKKIKSKISENKKKQQFAQIRFFLICFDVFCSLFIVYGVFFFPTCYFCSICFDVFCFYFSICFLILMFSSDFFLLMFFPESIAKGSSGKSFEH